MIVFFGKMIFSRTDYLVSNLIEFISCGFNLTAILVFTEVNNICNVITSNVLNIKEITHE